MIIDCEIDNIKTLKKGMKIILSIKDEHVRETLKDIYNFMNKPLAALFSTGNYDLTVYCEIGDIKTLKKGMKVTLLIGKEYVPNVMEHIYIFIKKPIDVEILVDEQEQALRLQQITEDQRRKIYAIFGDMAAYIGDTKDNIKSDMKRQFVRSTQYSNFSLSDCSGELASDFIEFLIEMCFVLGVPLKESPLKFVDNVDRYLIMCLEHGVCSICGQSGEVHHWDTVGMGRNRYKIDDSNHRKLSLCRIHHREAHVLGVKQFEQKYHVHGVIWNEEGDRVVNS